MWIDKHSSPGVLSPANCLKRSSSSLFTQGHVSSHSGISWTVKQVSHGLLSSCSKFPLHFNSHSAASITSNNIPFLAYMINILHLLMKSLVWFLDLLESTLLIYLEGEILAVWTSYDLQSTDRTEPYLTNSLWVVTFSLLKKKRNNNNKKTMQHRSLMLFYHILLPTDHMHME